MLTEIRAAVRPAFSLLCLFTLVLGIAYPLAVTGIAQLALPAQANGSLVTRDRQVIGSSLVGQAFVGPSYFHSRPSAAGDGYDASASAASNLAPGSRDLRDRIAGDIAKLRSQGLTGAQVPPDLVTTSASGLDPHISPEAAFAQTVRIAAVRNLADTFVDGLVGQHIDEPLFGFIGERRVNLLVLNMALDAVSANRQLPAPSATPMR